MLSWFRFKSLVLLPSQYPESTMIVSYSTNVKLQLRPHHWCLLCRSCAYMDFVHYPVMVTQGTKLQLPAVIGITCMSAHMIAMILFRRTI